MIALRPVLVRPGIVDSERVCKLPLACQIFFRNLLHVCDGAGRFSVNAAELRHALYRWAPGVSNPHVEAWLRRLHQDHLVKLYTRGALGYGEIVNYGQRDTKRKVLYPPPDEGELNFAGAEAAAPPGKGGWQKALNRIEEKSPQPPAEPGGGNSSDLPKKATQATAIRWRRAKRLETLHGEKERLSRQIEEIVRPCGRGYAQEPAELAKQSRLGLLRLSLRDVVNAIEERRGEVVKDQ